VAVVERSDTTVPGAGQAQLTWGILPQPPMQGMIKKKGRTNPPIITKSYFAFSLLRRRIAAFEVGEKPLDLVHPLAVELGESIPERGLELAEGARPERYRAQQQEGAADRAWQQESPDPHDDQQHPNFLGQGADQVVIVFHFLARD
jgi:hypothetical protein